METISPEVLAIVPDYWKKDSAEEGRDAERLQQAMRWMDVAYRIGRIHGAMKYDKMPEVPAPWEVPK